MGEMIANGLIEQANATGQGFGGGQMGSKYALPSLIAALRGQEMPDANTYTEDRFNTPEFLTPTISYNTPEATSASAGIAEDPGPSYTDIFTGQTRQFQ